METKWLKTSPLYAILIGLIVYSYIATKAYTTSFTHDESFSYLHYVHESFMDIVSFKCWFTNNHILNSLLMKYSELFFGNSEIALRLPNLLLFSVYMIYSFLLFRKTNSLLQLALFVILCSNNSLIDFFGLARGYGLSFGFMLMSLHHFIQSFSEQQKKHLILFHIGSLLAVLSSFMLLNFYVILLLMFNVLPFVDCKIVSQKKYNAYSLNKVHIIPIIINTIILYEPIRRAMMSRLDFGGKTGFYADTVTQLIHYCLHESNLSSTGLVISKIIFTALVAIAFVIIIHMIVKKEEIFFKDHKGLIVTTLLIIFMSIAIVFLHIFLNADYPISRFSLFMVPLFIVFFGFFLNYVAVYYKKTISILVIVLSLLSSISFAFRLDMHSCSEWGYDMETKSMIQKLTENRIKNVSDTTKVKLGINWLFEPTINFYIQTKNIEWILPVNRKGISIRDDYYYVFREELNKLNPSSYQIIFEFKRTNTLLLKSIQKCEKAFLNTH